MEKIKEMLCDIKSEVKYTRSMIGREALDKRVMKVLSEVPRHKFVDKEMNSLAYENSPLPIGAGQTISQPYIVAIMTDLLELDADSTVLEIGTGSGYQSAILSRLVKHVFSVEIIRELGEKAAVRLKRLGYSNISIRIADGNNGWPENAPYDAIMVTAASPVIPAKLIEQLKTGGKMIIPVGPPNSNQELLLIDKNENDDIATRRILPVVFVPLTSTGNGVTADYL